jgi:hypothetical protein
MKVSDSNRRCTQINTDEFFCENLQPKWAEFAASDFPNGLPSKSQNRRKGTSQKRKNEMPPVIFAGFT